MTESELIKYVWDDITVNGMIPLPVNDAVVKRNIITTKRYMYQHYDESVEPHTYVVRKQTFDSEEFKHAGRKIQLPECVVSVTNVQEIKGGGMLGSVDKDINENRLIASEIFLVAGHGDAIVYRTAQMSYYDLMKSFFVQGISYEYVQATHEIHLKGRHPMYDVLINTYITLPDDKLYNNYFFQRYLACLCKLDASRALSFVDFKLAGGIAISADAIKGEAESELSEIKEQIKRQQPPAWILSFH